MDYCARDQKNGQKRLDSQRTKYINGYFEMRSATPASGKYISGGLIKFNGDMRKVAKLFAGIARFIEKLYLMILNPY